MSDRTVTDSCKGKRAFDSYAEAKNALTNLRRYKGFHGPMTPYRCPFCHQMHLGNGVRTPPRRHVEIPEDEEGFVPHARTNRRAKHA